MNNANKLVNTNPFAMTEQLHLTEQDKRLIDLYNTLHQEDMLRLTIVQLSSTDFMYDISQCDQAITQLDHIINLLPYTDIPADKATKYAQCASDMIQYVQKYRAELSSHNSVKQQRTPLANKLVDTATTQLTFCKQNMV